MESNLAYDYNNYYRVEKINGEFVSMSPRPAVNHHRVTKNLSRIFDAYLDGHTCEYFSDGVDLYLTEEDWLIPDGMVVCDPGKVGRDGVYGAPDFIIEVLSPTSIRYDRGRKLEIYGRNGVREYWIIDPENKTVEIYAPENGRFILHDAYSFYPDNILSRMTPEEREKIQTEFHGVIFPDIMIKLDDLFKRTI